MVTTGLSDIVDENYDGRLKNTEVLNLDSKAVRVPIYQNHSQDLRGAVGGFVANKFITCGGKYNQAASTIKQCYKIGTTNTSHHGTMNKNRYLAAAVVLADKVWILGGLDENNDPLKYTEYIFHNGAQEDGPEMKVPLQAHTSIQINETAYMVAGGMDSGGITEQTWVYSNESGLWVEGPVLNKRRYYHSIGRIRDSVTHKDYIVVTGGMSEPEFHLKDTEILEIYGTEWKSGKHLHFL